jgi:hypothetical protein
MNEQLQVQMASILASIQEATGKASDFAMGQLPDIAQQYLTYGRVSNLALLLLSGVRWRLLFLWLYGMGV